MATGIKKLLFIDTNIWLDFYRARNEAYIELLKRIEGISTKIIVTHQLETEYKKNRQSAILEGVSVLKVPAPIPSVGVLSNAKAFEMLGRDLDSAAKRVKDLEAKLIRLMERPAEADPVYQTCQRIFHKSDALVLTRDNPKRKLIRNRAQRRFLHGCPPRKKGDTSYGDSINWEWMIECAINQNAELVIVSRDNDYGASLKSRSYINDHLLQEFKERVSQKRELLLYSKVSDALRHFHVPVTRAQEIAEEQLLDDEPSSIAAAHEFEDLTAKPNSS